MYQKLILAILDGWGLGQEPESDAIRAAHTPIFDSLMQHCPNSRLVTFGEDVGLPPGQMGNSEVGHLNIGAGRIVYQDLLRINRDIASGELWHQTGWQDVLKHVHTHNGTLHIMGLVSDGGVHAHIDHLLGIIDWAVARSISRIFIHAFTDGRDTDPHGGYAYIDRLQRHIQSGPARIATIIGRYYAMDRDKRWDRTAKAYNLLVHGLGYQYDDACASIEASYNRGLTDEFIEPICLDQEGLIRDGDTVFFFNYRSDRPRQLVTMLALESFPDQHTVPLDIGMFTMTPYEEDWDRVYPIYHKETLVHTFSDLVSDNGLTQLHIAETEKYAHVTYFFNGGREDPVRGEYRILIPSPKVATYDLQPEMSALPMTDALLRYLNDQSPDFVCINFANTDMVGHTGVFEAARIAAETVDRCVGRIVASARTLGYDMLIIADHGNSDYMINADGTPNTAHTTNLVPCLYVSSNDRPARLIDGRLADVAPTLAHIMGLVAPAEMTGHSLIEFLSS